MTLASVVGPTVGPIVRTFENTGDEWSAAVAAQTWLADQGYVVGTMESRFPRAILHRDKARGERTLPKWKYVDHCEDGPFHEWWALDGIALDGIMESDDWRNGSVAVFLFAPEVAK